MNRTTVFNEDTYAENIELVIKSYIERLSSEDLLKLSENHLDRFDYGMMADRIIDKEINEREL